MKKPFHCFVTAVLAAVLILSGCGQADSGNAAMAAEPADATAPNPAPASEQQQTDGFQYEAERFADVRMLRYQVPGFDQLSLQQKKLLYFLSQAGMAGRDIMWDQNYRHNLRIRRTLEEVVKHYPGDRDSEEFSRFMTYVKRIWFANGIHHHYSNNKFQPRFSPEYFASLLQTSEGEADFPLREGQSLDQLIALLTPIIFDPEVDAKKVSTAPDGDKVLASAVNFYQGVTEDEVTAFYAERARQDDETPVSHGLNSKMVKVDGELTERVWKLDGMYGEAIEQIVYWLEQAVAVAENEQQEKALSLLIDYYRSGDLEDFAAYNVAWVEDTHSAVDAINGFIEVYDDPLGYRGAYESVVSFRDEEATARIETIARNAQWFEDNSPIMDAHKKAEVVGITGKAITVVSETGDASPASPSGINLPNSSWIRAQHGSKSVSLSNITAAYNSSESGVLEEFAYTAEEAERSRTYSELAGHLFTDMHEVIGHASGKLDPGVGTTRETLKQYASPLEEGRADLVALYYLMDPKLIEIGVMPDLELGRAAYDNYIRGALMTQLYRIEPGEQIEEAHMRNRQANAAWVYEKGQADKVIERIERDGKTYFVINDYQRLRELFGELLREHQRIKSEGDFAAAQQLMETYGTKVEPELHQEVLARYSTLNVAPYSGFINPRLVPVIEDSGQGEEIVDVRVEYPDDFTRQMLDYAENYSFLPTDNMMDQ